MNGMCATCHAKLIPLSLDFVPGDKFFDHFDLVVLDHQDYYPDGRDLGENYTYTSWLMSPCAAAGKLDCNHCHTPSGRLRFAENETNKSCLPCHQDLVDNPVPHGHHQPGSKGNDCVGCHMPKTRFAAMARTDHSMLPPTPAATIALKSPNACNFCHADKDAAWSDEWVRKWYPSDYQAPVIERATLLDAARKGDWKRLPEMLEKVAGQQEDAVYRASLVRLLRGCPDQSKWPALVKALADDVAFGPLERRVRPGGPSRRRVAPGVAGRHARSVPAGADSGGAGPGAPAHRATAKRERPPVARPGGRGVQDRDAGPARRLGRICQPGQLLHGSGRFPSCRGVLRDGDAARTADDRSDGQRVDGLQQPATKRQGRGQPPPSTQSGADERGGAVQPRAPDGRRRPHERGGGRLAGGLEVRSANGRGRVQSGRPLRQVENRGSAEVVPQGPRARARQRQIREHAGHLPPREGQNGSGDQNPPQADRPAVRPNSTPICCWARFSKSRAKSKLPRPFIVRPLPCPACRRRPSSGCGRRSRA